MTESEGVTSFGDGPRTKHCGQPLEARKCKEVDSPLEPQEGMQSCRNLAFRISDLQKCKITHEVCGKLLQQQ